MFRLSCSVRALQLARRSCRRRCGWGLHRPWRNRGQGDEVMRERQEYIMSLCVSIGVGSCVDFLLLGGVVPWERGISSLVMRTKPRKQPTNPMNVSIPIIEIQIVPLLEQIVQPNIFRRRRHRAIQVHRGVEVG
jgi:hypothetical protein